MIQRATFRQTRYIAALLFLAVASVTAPAAANGQQPPGDAVETSIAIQPFQHGFMLWRQDNGQITVALTDIKTKVGAPCQEVYLDTFQGQTYEIPAAPSGLTVPELGFGWLYSRDAELAQRLGYATTDEVSLVAQIRTVSTSDGQALQLQLSQDLPNFANPFMVAYTDEPGLTYCFARSRGRRADLNTWVALQRFDHGFMMWRQDLPDRVEVAHDDTDLAPEIGCLDRFADTWRPGEVLSYGDLAIPDRFLPDRGFGKVWLQNEYVRDSLGYPIEQETGGFAEATYEPFHHPRRGDLQIRKMVIHLPSGEDLDDELTSPGGVTLGTDNRLSQGCRTILIPHQQP